MTQDVPALAVSPGKVNLRVGESHVFHAVGKDGRIRHHVRWSITPEPAARRTQNGDEATVQAAEIAGNRRSHRRLRRRLCQRQQKSSPETHVREDVVELLAARHLRRDEKPRAGNPWLIEEAGFRCAISFDAGNGTVVKKNKTVVTDQKRPTAHCAS